MSVLLNFNFLVIFLELELTSDGDIKQLCYESLKEVIPGGKGMDLILRSRVWNLIEESRLNDSTSNYVRTHNLLLLYRYG